MSDQVEADFVREFVATSRDPAIGLELLASHPQFAEEGFLPGLCRELISLQNELNRRDLTSAAIVLRKASPRGSLVWHLTDRLLRRAVPSWHWPMLHDTSRNEAYSKAIKALVSPESTVFEIGCGSGLLSILAAQAGARHVFACEKNSKLAALARENIQRAGLEDRITVINKRAENLRFGRDIDRQCDIVIHELLSDDLVGEGMLDVLEEIDKDIYAPSVTFLPNHTYARIQGVSNRHLIEPHISPVIESIDLSAIDVLAPASSIVPPFVGVTPVGAAHTIMECTIESGGVVRSWINPVEMSELFDIGAVGIIQWIGFSFPDGTRYENGPGSLSHWLWGFYPIDNDDKRPGRTLRAEITDKGLVICY